MGAFFFGFAPFLFSTTFISLPFHESIEWAELQWMIELNELQAMVKLKDPIPRVISWVPISITPYSNTWISLLLFIFGEHIEASY